MKVGEVCLLTGDVVRLANFYKALLDIENGSQSSMHQTLIAEETMLTVLHEDVPVGSGRQTLCLAFTVEDIQAEYQRLLGLGARVIEQPTRRPWGTTNLCFLDPDGNRVYLRSFQP